MGQLSSVMSIAGAGLLPNPPGDVGTAIVANTASVDRYSGLPFVSNVITVVNSAVIEAAANNISSSTVSGIITLGASNFPALTDTITPGTVIANILVSGFCFD